MRASSALQARSLRVHLLRLLLPPIAALLALGAVAPLIRGRPDL